MRNFFKAMSITFVIYLTIQLTYSIFQGKPWIHSAALSLALLLWVYESIKDFNR